MQRREAQRIRNRRTTPAQRACSESGRSMFIPQTGARHRFPGMDMATWRLQTESADCVAKRLRLRTIDSRHQDRTAASRRAALERPRLLALLPEVRSKPLTVIKVAAGFGKTCGALAWRQQGADARGRVARPRPGRRHPESRFSWVQSSNP